MRVERFDGAELWLGDVRECSAMASADSIVTDPVWPNCPPGLLAGSDDPAGLLKEVLAPLNPTRASIVLRNDSDPRFLASVPTHWPFVCLQALPYAIPMYVGRVLGGTEIAYGFGKVIPVSAGRRLIPMWGPKAQPRDRRSNGHPCSRSLVHMEWLVGWWSQPGETVADPFMGSATTGVAALLHGRKFIGCEVNPAYFDIACREIETALTKLPMLEATA